MVGSSGLVPSVVPAGKKRRLVLVGAYGQRAGELAAWHEARRARTAELRRGMIRIVGAVVAPGGFLPVA
jgi:hypothetical protein